MAVRELDHGVHRYIWDTADVKPTATTHGVTTGSTGYDRQTGIMYITYDGTNWVEKDTIVRLETSPTIDIGDVTLLAGTAVVGKVNIKRVPIITPTTGTSTTLANLTPAAAFHLLGVRIHVGSALASAETLTVTNNSGTASAYDTVLFSLDMGTPDIRDLVIPFGGDEDFFGASDVIDIVLSANAGGDTWGCETIHELV